MELRKYSLIFFALLFISPLSCAQSFPIYWEDYSLMEKRIVLTSDLVDSVVLDYYRGNLIVSDNEITFQLLNVLLSNNAPRVKSLYFWIFNKIVFSADGALAEILGPYCMKRLLMDSPYVLDYLRSHPAIEDDYLLFLAEEFLYGSTSSLSEFKKGLRGQCNREIEPYLQEFLDKLEKQISVLNGDLEGNTRMG